MPKCARCQDVGCVRAVSGHDSVTNEERALLERLASAGKPSRVLDEEVELAKALEGLGIIFMVGAYAIITPKGRHRLADAADAKRRGRKPPIGFLD